MSPQDIAALLRRHVIAVGLVLVLAAGLAYHLTHMSQGYRDTATIAFTGPTGSGFFTDTDSLLVIDELDTNTVMSAAGQLQVRNAGGTADYNVTLINLNDEDFPDYGEPYVFVVTSSPDPGAARRTMSAVLTALTQDLSSLQARQGAKPSTRITLRAILNPSGPVAQTGSKKRVLVGLVVLTVIVVFVTALLLDRFPVRPRELVHRRWRQQRREAARMPGRSRHIWSAQ